MLVATDFDGTLAEIVRDPAAAAPLPGALAALRELAARSDFRVAVVSGRALNDLRARCPLDHAWFVGGHGNESFSPDGDDLQAVPAPEHAHLRARLEQIAADLRRRLPAWPGVELEIKPFSLAVHFRNAPEWTESIRQVFSELAAAPAESGPASAHPPFRVLMGRQVIELLPENALTKGHAVQRLRNRLGCDLAFYFGDDVTDEDVFRLQDPHLIGVKVAHAESTVPTAAQYSLGSPEQVVQGLWTLIEERPSLSAGSGIKKKLRVSPVQP